MLHKQIKMHPLALRQAGSVAQGAHITLGCRDLHAKKGVPVLQCRAVPTKVGHPIPRTFMVVELEGGAAQMLPWG